MKNYKRGAIVTFFLFSVLIISSCSENVTQENLTENDINTNDSLSIAHIDKKTSSKKFKGFNDREYYPDLDELARVLALYQDDYSHTMIKAMKESRVKENILNLTKGNKIDKKNLHILNLNEKIEITFEKRDKTKTKEIKVKNLLKKLQKDINLYFPIDSHRVNVLEKNEDFWVVFNPPDHGNEEYYVSGYNKFGEEKLFSSNNKLPKENIAVLAYSENQEAYSSSLADSFTEVNNIIQPCIMGDSECEPVDPPPPVEMAKGLNITKFRTVNYDDGFLDGDLEVKIRIQQLGTTGDINGIPFNVSTYDFINYAYFSHHAGDWYWYWYEFRFRNSNKSTYINRRRKISERKILVTIPLVGPVYYDEFNINAVEEDPLADDVLGSHSFHLSHQFGGEWELGTGIFVVVDYKDYPLSSY